MTPCLIAIAVAMSSTPPLAPSRWPIMLLVLLIASLRAWSPKTRLIATVSATSQLGAGAMGVDVLDVLRMQPCVLERELHRLGGPAAFRVRGSDVVRVGRAAK